MPFKIKQKLTDLERLLLNGSVKEQIDRDIGNLADTLCQKNKKELVKLLRLAVHEHISSNRSAQEFCNWYFSHAEQLADASPERPQTESILKSCYEKYAHWFKMERDARGRLFVEDNDFKPDLNPHLVRHLLEY